MKNQIFISLSISTYLAKYFYLSLYLYYIIFLFAAPLTRPLTGGPRPSEASPSSRHHSGELKLIAGELSTSAVGRAGFPNSTRTH